MNERPIRVFYVTIEGGMRTEIEVFDGSIPRPATVTSPMVPAGIMSIGHTGSVQVRGRASAGRTWTETWPPLKAGEEKTEKLLALLETAYNQGLVLELEHLLLRGSGKSPDPMPCTTMDSDCREYYGREVDWGEPTVAGAVADDRKGSVIITTGWTARDVVMGKIRGNVVQFGDPTPETGPKTVRRVVGATAVSGDDNGISLIVNPPAFEELTSGTRVRYGRVYNTPMGSMMKTREAVRLHAVITRFNVPTAQPNEFYGGLSVEFREVPG